MSDYSATHNGIGIEIHTVDGAPYVFLQLPEVPAEWKFYGVTSHNWREYALEAMELSDAILAAQALADELSERLAKFPAVLDAYHAADDALDDAYDALRLARDAMDKARDNLQDATP